MKCSECNPHLFGLVKLFLRLGTALLIRPSDNCPISSPVRLLIQKLFWASDEDYKIASCITPQTWYIHGVQIWRVIKWPLLLFNHLQTVLIEALLSDTCSASESPMHLVESAAPSDSSWMHSEPTGCWFVQDLVLLPLPTSQHSGFYRLDVLPTTAPRVLKHRRHSQVGNRAVQNGLKIETVWPNTNSWTRPIMVNSRNEFKIKSTFFSSLESTLWDIVALLC